MKLSRTYIHFNKYIIWLSLIIFFSLNGFYLIDDTKVPTGNIALVLEVLFIGYVCFFNRQRVTYKYKLFMFAPVLLAVTSSYMAYLSYGQPFILGLRAQRTWIFTMLMYFPICKLLKLGKLEVCQLISMIDKLNIIYMFLVALQWLVGTKMQFMTVLSNERYGSIRLYVSLAFVMISYFVHLMSVIEGKHLKISDWFFVLSGLFMLIFVTKSRMGIVAVLSVTLLAMLLHKTTLKKLLIIAVAIITGFAFLISPVGRDIITMATDPSQSSQDTSSIRDAGRTFYIEQTMKTPLRQVFGCGFANITWKYTVIGINYTDNYNYNDNGIFGLFFYYGFAFVIWMIILYLTLFHDSWRANKKYLFYYLFQGVLGIMTLFPSCYDTTIAFPVLCAFAEYAICEKNYYLKSQETCLKGIIEVPRN